MSDGHDFYREYREKWRTSLIKRGLTQSESDYVINRMCNAIRKYGGEFASISGLNISINNDRDVRPEKDVFKLNCGKEIRIGFDAD